MLGEGKKKKYSDKNSLFSWSILHNLDYNLVFIGWCANVFAYLENYSVKLLFNKNQSMSER